MNIVSSYWNKNDQHRKYINNVEMVVTIQMTIQYINKYEFNEKNVWNLQLDLGMP